MSDKETFYLIDFEKYGNTVRFYFGNEEHTRDSWGDDWNDRPYEHNAGSVYPRYIDGYLEVVWSLNNTVLEPSEGADNYYTSFSKEDMKNGLVPCVIVYPRQKEEYMWQCNNFFYIVGNNMTTRFYYGADKDTILDLINCTNGIVLINNFDLSEEDKAYV